MRNKRIIFAIPKNSLFEKPLTAAFHQYGYDVIVLDYRASHLARVTFDLLRLVIEKHPSIFFTVKGEVFHPVIIRLLRRMGIVTVNWYPDDAFQLRTILRFADVFDVLFTFDPFILRELKKRGKTNTYLLQFAATPARSFHVLTQRYPLVFIGQPDATRIHILQKIASFGLSVWGPWEDTPLAPFLQKRWVELHEVERVYRQAGIVINIHSHSFGDSRDDRTEGTNIRTFMAAGVGAFQLIEWRRDLDRLFIEGEEMVTFRGIADLKRKISYYLNHPEKRHAIAKRAYLRVRRDHTYDKRMREMMGVVRR